MTQGALEPLKTLEELLHFQEAPLVAVEPMRYVKRGDDPQAPRTLFCHDMMGGYLEDRYIHGCSKIDAYRFHHWQIINTFVYYSHHMVTIPPPGWISSGHRHGVQVLGTFTLEGETSLAAFKMMRGTGIEKKVAAQLAHVAALYSFDGWLVNVGFEMVKCCVASINKLLSAIVEETHRAVPGSQIIWFDGINRDGRLRKQSKLNINNASFFHLCDGILLSFDWTEGMLESSARHAHDRKSDVYVGVDVFARNTQYEGGYDTYKAVEMVRKHGLSAGIFAAGWVYETEDKAKFSENQCKLWRFPEHCSPEWQITMLPLTSSFCQGFGSRVYKQGKVTSSLPWFNLCKQQLQPRDQGTWPCGNGVATALVNTQKAYNGGGCLRIEFAPGVQLSDDLPYFRLFGCDLPLGSLAINYTFYDSNINLSASDVALVLVVSGVTGEKEQIWLGLSISLPEGNRYAATRDVTGEHATWSEWVTRWYDVRDLSGSLDARLVEVGVGFTSPMANTCLLGQVVVQRPTVTEERVDEVGGDEESDDESLDDASLDMLFGDDGEPPVKRIRFDAPAVPF